MLAEKKKKTVGWYEEVHTYVIELNAVAAI